MTAETPLTDAAQAAYEKWERAVRYGKVTVELVQGAPMVGFDFARTLERDLTAARARVAELETFVRWVATYPETRGEEINVTLIRENARALLSPSPEPKP